MIQEHVFRQLPTPAYLFDADALTERMQLIRRHLGEQIRIVYAVKANPFLIRSLLPQADGLEVCSPGEERICRWFKAPSGKLVLSGVNKERENFRELLGIHKDQAVYTAESVRQAELLDCLAREQGLVLRVLLRLSSGNQFGMDEAAITGILQNRERYSGLVFAGMQYFTGTQKKMKKILSEVSYMDEVMERLRTLTAGEGPEYFSELEYGPGLPVSYFTGDHAVEDSEILSELREALSHMRFSGRITLEMGRFIAAKSGYYLTKVVDMKQNEGAAYCIVDGGIHQMNYFGQMMGMKLPGIQLLHGDGEETPGPEHWTVCGSLCTTADDLVRDCPLPGLRINDLLVFEQTGAYSMTEGISLFLSRDLPAVYLYEGGRLKEMRKKMNTEDLNCGRTDCNT